MLANNFRRCTGVLQIQIRNYAARKGTRERKKKAKVKVEQKKVGFIPHNIRNRDMSKLLPKRFDDSMKRDCTDNVFVAKYFKVIRYPFVEAVQCHKETHHPDIYNQPNAKLHLTIELNMLAEKKTRFLDNFTRIAGMPYRFDHGDERKVMAFSKDAENQKIAADAGADLTGGVELIKQIQSGEISLFDYKYIVAHPDILQDLVLLRGLMKRKFPNHKNDTLTADLAKIVNKLMYGISYTAIKNEFEKDFGTIETIIGTVDMDAVHLEQNFASLIQDINIMRPKRDGTFIMRCLLWSPPSREELMVDFEKYIEAPKTSRSIQETEEKEEETKQAAVQ